MADWSGLRRYIKSKYIIADDGLDTLKLLFNTGDNRGQAIFISHAGTIGGSDWAEIATVVCDESQIDAREAMVRNGKMVVGGLALLDGVVVFRHSIPLINLDPEEFEIPLQVVVLFGDKLESELSGGDRF